VVNARDIFLGHAQGERFETLELELLLEEPTPLVAAEFANRVHKNKLLVLGGTYEEKPDVARQIARVLVSETPRNEKEDTRPMELRIRERSHTSDFETLLRAIREEKTPAVLLLHDVQPQSLAYNVGRVRDEASRGQHLVLITTERPNASWEVALQGLQDCWVELHSDQLFDQRVLADDLIKRMNGARSRLPEGVFKEEYEPLRSRIGGVELAEIARRLQTPRRVDAFVEQLCLLAREQRVRSADIERLISEATSLERQLTRWFETRLSSDEQLLAIALNFFDGLLDDQCFSALEKWMAHIRAHRDPTQRAFDYIDVENLKDYFQVKSDLLGTRFRALSVAHRRCLFKVAWRTHRRKLISALPVLTRMAAQSDDWELNGSQEQLDELRSAVSDTLAEIGTFSVSAVQRSLLSLASSRDPWVQFVAARAMAIWRVLGKGAQFLETVEHWRTDTRPREIVRAFIGGHDTPDHPGPMEFIHATLALTVAVAATYDPPNKLDPHLMVLLKQSAQERHGFVRSRFIHTMRSVTALHLEQCREQGLLRHLLRKHPELALTIGSSLAHAYPVNRDQVMKTLDTFHAESERPSFDGPTRITLLCTLAYAYGSMKYGSDGPLTARMGLTRLHEMLNRESDSEVRRAVVEAISFQALRGFQHVAPLLQRLMAELDREETEEFVTLLKDIYLKQRQSLRGGDVRMHWKGRYYRVWLGSKRPLTDIEKVMLVWSQEPDFPVAQQIALRASIAFAESLDKEEVQFIVRQTWQREQEARRNAVPEAMKSSTRASSENSSWYTRVFVPTLVTLFTRGQRRAEHRRIISGLLALSLTQKAREPESLAFVLEKWEQQGDPNMGTIVKKLRTAMEWHSYARWLLIAGGVVLLLWGKW
jgi:hypothetical protein